MVVVLQPGEDIYVNEFVDKWKLNGVSQIQTHIHTDFHQTSLLLQGADMIYLFLTLLSAPQAVDGSSGRY